jgi:hypothetical protein
VKKNLDGILGLYAHIAPQASCGAAWELP